MAAAAEEKVIDHPIQIKKAPKVADGRILYEAYKTLKKIYPQLLDNPFLTKQREAFQEHYNNLYILTHTDNHMAYNSAKNALAPMGGLTEEARQHSPFWTDVNNFINYVKGLTPEKRETHRETIRTCATQFEKILNETKETHDTLGVKFYKHLNDFLPPETLPRKDAKGQERAYYAGLLEQITATLESLESCKIKINPLLHNDERSSYSSLVDNDYTRLLRKLRAQQELVTEHLNFFDGPRGTSDSRSAEIAAANTPEEHHKLLRSLCTTINTAKASWHKEERLMSSAERVSERAALDGLFRPIINGLCTAFGIPEQTDTFLPPEPANIANMLLLRIETGYDQSRKRPMIELVEIDTSRLSAAETFQTDLIREVLAGLQKVTGSESQSSIGLTITKLADAERSHSQLVFGSGFFYDSRQYISTPEQLKASPYTATISVYTPSPTAEAKAAAAEHPIRTFLIALRSTTAHAQTAATLLGSYRGPSSWSNAAFRAGFLALDREELKGDLRSQFQAIVAGIPTEYRSTAEYLACLRSHEGASGPAGAFGGGGSGRSSPPAGAGFGGGGESSRRPPSTPFYRTATPTPASRPDQTYRDAINKLRGQYREDEKVPDGVSRLVKLLDAKEDITEKVRIIIEEKLKSTPGWFGMGARDSKTTAGYELLQKLWSSASSLDID